MRDQMLEMFYVVSTLALGLVAIILLIVWACITFAVVVEIADRIRGKNKPPQPDPKSMAANLARELKDAIKKASGS